MTPVERAALDHAEGMALWHGLSRLVGTVDPDKPAPGHVRRTEQARCPAQHAHNGRR